MFSFFFLSTLLAVVPFDHSDWDGFLKKFVNGKGEVRYTEAKLDSSLLDSYLKKVKEIPTEELDNWPREERLALWINVFNAGVIQQVLQHYPVKTVMEIPGFWENQAVEVGREPKDQGGRARVYSLSQIENDILWRTFRDEKVLFVLARGGRGSPRLRPEAFQAAPVEGQLYLATREFANDPSHNLIELERKKVTLSKLFDWYDERFLINWGDFQDPPKGKYGEMAVLSFFAHYLEDPKKTEFLKEGEYKVKYKPFDWRLNDQAPGDKT